MISNPNIFLCALGARFVFLCGHLIPSYPKYP